MRKSLDVAQGLEIGKYFLPNLGLDRLYPLPSDKGVVFAAGLVLPSFAKLPESEPFAWDL